MVLDRPALLVQLQPITPWRCGYGVGEEDSAALVSSDTLHAALRNAASRLGWDLSQARGTRLTSLYPAQQDIFYAPVPEPLRGAPGLRRLRLHAVRFATLSAISSLASRKFEENRWVLDLASGCLLPSDRGGAGGPFRILERKRAAVDRLSGSAVATAETTGLDFGTHGLAWTLLTWSSAEEAEQWLPRWKAAFRLLTDDGIGGWRSAGWGRSRRPRFREGSVLRLLEQMGWESNPETQPTGWLALGLLHPGENDAIQWESGSYRTVLRGGWSAGSETARVRFVREGSVLVASSEPEGALVTLPGDSRRARFGAGVALPWQGEI
jgi:CRISPR type III-A-associated RAMP protein Csm4